MSNYKDYFLAKARADAVGSDDVDVHLDIIREKKRKREQEIKNQTSSTSKGYYADSHDSLAAARISLVFWFVLMFTILVVAPVWFMVSFLIGWLPCLLLGDFIARLRG